MYYYFNRKSHRWGGTVNIVSMSRQSDPGRENCGHHSENEKSGRTEEPGGRMKEISMVCNNL